MDGITAHSISGSVLAASWPVAMLVLVEGAESELLLRSWNARAEQLLQGLGWSALGDALPLAALLGWPEGGEAMGLVATAVRAQQPLHWSGSCGGSQLQLEALPADDGSWLAVLTPLEVAHSARELPALSSQKVLDGLPTAIALMELSGEADPRVAYLNQHFVDTFGYPREQIQRLSDWKSAAYPDLEYRAAVFRDWDAAVERAIGGEGRVPWMEFRVRAADGTDRQVLFQASVINDLLMVTLLDVSDRRLVEGELLDARAELARTALEVTESIPVGTYTMVLRPGSPMAQFSFLSDRFLELTGLTREDALADPFKAFACVHPDDYDHWVEMNAKVFAEKKPFFGETRIIRDAQVRWITAESSPRDLADGSTVWEGVLIDVTDRIEAQMRLQRSQLRLQRILNRLPVPIAINDLNPENPAITFLNETFQSVLGYTLDDIPTVRDWAALAYPDPAYRQAVMADWQASMQRAMTVKGSVEQAEYRVCAKDGRELILLISALVLEDEVLIAFLDVTAIRQAQAELRQAFERDQQQAEALRLAMEEKLRVSLTASAVAHEISQPLSTILLNCKLALRELGNEPTDGSFQLASLRELLQPLIQESMRVEQTTDRIRMLLRNVETRRQPVDLRDVVSVVMLQMRAPVDAIGGVLMDSCVDHPCMILGDAVQLQLALGNLLRNGLEAASGCLGPEDSVQLRINLVPDGGGFRLSVADNGPGLPVDCNPRMPLHSSKQGGTGLGLYLVQLTMDNHGGSLALGSSAELGGAELSLWLPALNG